MRLLLIQLLALFGVAFVIATIIVTQRARYDYEISESDTLIRSVSSGITSNVGTYKDLSRLVMLNPAVITFLRAEEVDAGIINDARFGVMDVMNVTSNLDSVFIFRNDDEYMSTGRVIYDVDFELMADPQWRWKILEKRGGASVLINANNAIFRRNNTSVVTIARAIYDIYSQELTGILLMNFSTDMLEETLLDKRDSRLCIVTDTGEYLAGDQALADRFDEDMLSDKILHNSTKVEKNRGMFSSYHIPDMPLVIMCFTESKFGVLPAMTIYALFIIVLVFSIGIVLAAQFITNNITNPISELATAMESSHQPGLMEKLDVEMPQNEIGMLAGSYNNMIDRLNHLFEELIEKEKSIQRAELQVLHEQIKPHFLYNSMETISYMALSSGAEEVHDALETLGSFYRNFLSKGDREIPLSREINIIKDYLAIQKLRYGDIIMDEYDVAEEVLDWRVPKLILQPLVENSLYHGIRPMGEPGVIRITGFLKEDRLHLIVYDSGMGMSQESIDKMLSTENRDETEEAQSGLSGFGLKGTIDRVRYFCGEDNVVQIRSSEGEFTEIEFIIAKI